MAQFVRFYNDEDLQDQEKLLRFRSKHSIHIVPDSFLFQEGHAEFYENAKYGVFKFDDRGNHLLVGLANEQLATIELVE
ncbi:MAG: putative membrane-anchored protein [Cellvibrionaceae bacterium]